MYIYIYSDKDKSKNNLYSVTYEDKESSTRNSETSNIRNNSWHFKAE